MGIDRRPSRPNPAGGKGDPTIHRTHPTDHHRPAPARTRMVVAVLCAAFLLSVALPVLGTHVQDKLTADDAGDNDRFGIAVALDGTTALVGAHGEDGAGLDLGAAYVYARTDSGWAHQQKLTADDAQDGDQLGFAVALDGDTALVGAYLEDGGGTDRGAAYVFTRSGDTWTQQQKLTLDDARDGDLFGIAVAVDGDTALIGASRKDGAGSDQGAAYVYARSGGTWSMQQNLTPGDAEASDRFGIAVALDGDTALIGASRENGGGIDRGAAYVFTRSGGAWTEEQKLTADDAANSDQLGRSVALDGDTAVVGAPFEGGGEDRGAAYVFTRNGGAWTQEELLAADDGADGDWFGFSVALDGDVALAGAPREDGNGADRGAAYRFARSDGAWTQEAKITADDASAEDEFGWSVGIDGEVALVGARGEDGAGTDRGAAYVVALNDPPAAAFDWTPADPVAGDQVAFTDASTDDGTIVSWAWDLGDGNTSAEQDPTHAFADAGTYPVCLTVTDEDGADDTTCVDLTVAPGPDTDPPVADFTWTPLGSPALTAEFVDNSTDPDGTIEAWAWDFGDGSPGETVPDPTHTFPDEGLHTVCLTVTDDAGAKGTRCRDVGFGGSPPDAAFALDPADPVAGDPVAFTDRSTDADGSVVAWTWDLGDGATADGRDASHTYGSKGTYAVCLTATDDDGLADTACRDVAVRGARPRAAFSVSGDGGGFLAGEAVAFLDDSTDPDGEVVAWFWDFGDGATATEAEPTHVFAAAGTYTVTLAVTDDDGQSHATSADLVVDGTFPWGIAVGLVLLGGALGGGAYWYARMGGEDRVHRLLRGRRSR